VSLQDNVQNVSSMLSNPELVALRSIAKLGRPRISSMSSIVDLGCFSGGSTYALASGLINSKDRLRRIKSYDLFEMHSNYDSSSSLVPGVEVGSSFRHVFDSNVELYKDFIDVFHGDIINFQYADGPIDVLFVDICKTWKINDHVNKQFLPYLSPKFGVLIQQDYVHEWLPWIHISMGLLSNYFTEVGTIGGCSRVFLCKKQIPLSAIPEKLKDMTKTELVYYFDLAYSKIANRDDQAILNCTRAVLLNELGENQKAKELMGKIENSNNSERFKSVFKQVDSYLSV
jgi:hypothetical protein